MEATLDDYKLSCELFGHSMDVRAVAVAGVSDADGSDVILSGSRDKTVKVWKRTDVAEYSESLTFQDHKNFIACVYYLEAEKWICTGSNDATVCIYKEGGYVPILTLKGHDATVCCISGGVAPQSIITGSWDKTARIWSVDALGGSTSVRCAGHEAAVWAVASMPEVKKFITGSADKCIFYWNERGERLRMLKGHTDCVRGVLTGFPLGGLASCANDAIIRYWNDDGECVRELTGHTNYIYAVAQNRALGDEVVVSCGEDSTLRMWNLTDGRELGAAIVHPAQSVWSVACLRNGDIVTGSSDGVVRIFTKDPQRVANETTLKAFDVSVTARKAQINEMLGDVKKTDLAGPEALLTDGTQEGQMKMVRHSDGSVKCYNWELGKWNLIGDVTGGTGGTQASSGKTLYEGKEYDFVFSVDISDTAPAIKLPYNRGEDPWTAAQAFIHRNNLPQAYLDQVADFIVKNSGSSGVSQPTTSGYQDPFTGGSRYVPGMSNNNFHSTDSDPFTGASSYSTAASRQQPKVDVNFVKGADKHFPVGKYITFDNCDPSKVLVKLNEFNHKLTNDNEKVSETLLEAVVKLADATPEVDQIAIEALQHLLRWPSDILFPVLDIARLAIRNEGIFTLLSGYNFLDAIVVPQMTGSASVPNQLMAVRCLANMMCHATGRQQVDARLPTLVEHITAIKSGSVNLQIGIATFYLNVATAQTLAGVTANGERCRLATEGLIELLRWAVDLEACYRAMQAIGTLTTTPFGQETAALVISVENVIAKIRELTNTPQPGVYAKLNSAGTALLAAF